MLEGIPWQSIGDVSIWGLVLLGVPLLMMRGDLIPR